MTSHHGQKALQGKGVHWDLTDMYKSVDDPQLDKDVAEALSRAKAFAAKHKGHIAGNPKLDAKAMLDAIVEIEHIYELVLRAVVYADLKFSEDTREAKHGALVQKTKERSTEVQQELIFFQLEWVTVDDALAERIMADKSLARYQHFLRAERRWKPHKLTEKEEQLYAALNNVGREAFIRLFDESVYSLKVTIEHNGKSEEIPLEAALSKLYSGDRELRKVAAKAITKTLVENKRQFNFIYNTLLHDKAIEDKLRKYPRPISWRNLNNELDDKTIDALIETCGKNLGLVARYYRLKKRLVGYDKLYDYDRYSPINATLPQIPFEDGKVISLDAYRRFSPQLADVAQLFFDKHWIHAEVMDGKRGGAFSQATTPKLHPYNLLNYTDEPSDVMTMAHELGHGIHQYLAADKGILEMDAPLPLAETASVFGEMLTFEKLMEEAKSDEVKLALVCGKIEENFATVFRQYIFTVFETRVHTMRREKGELTAEQIGELWFEENQRMFGDSLELSEDYKAWWEYILHFYHYPFYCYAYAFGLMLVLSIYAKYKAEGDSFKPKYVEMLKSGGSRTPYETMKLVGVDIADPKFWQGGMDLLEMMVAQAEELAKKTGK